MKTVESKIAPNPKEAQYWVDLSEDKNGGVVKSYTSNGWQNINPKHDEMFILRSYMVDETATIALVKPQSYKLKPQYDKQLKEAITNKKLICVDFAFLSAITQSAV